MKYEQNNIFSKILRNEVPANIVYENDNALAFSDVSPKAPVHILVIPKGQFTCFYDFIRHATPVEVADLNEAVEHVIEAFDLQKTGFRLITNQGEHGGQEVPHYHVHVLGGHPLGPMVSLT